MKAQLNKGVYIMKFVGIVLVCFTMFYYLGNLAFTTGAL